MMEMENTTLKRNDLTLILLAAGKGERFKSKKPKQFVYLKGKPVIAHSLVVIKKLLPFKELIIVTNPIYQKKIKRICSIYCPSLLPYLKFADGGETRQASLLNGLTISTSSTLLLHEAARPFVTVNMFKKLLLDEEPNITLGVPIPFTVLEQEEGSISKLLTRDKLFNVQLPQKFDLQKLYEAHKKAKAEGKEFSDDSSLLFYYGTPVKVIAGEQSNIKLTYSKKDGQ